MVVLKTLSIFFFIIISSIVLYLLSFFYVEVFLKTKHSNIVILGMIYIPIAVGIYHFSYELSEKILGYSYSTKTQTLIDMGGFYLISLKFFTYPIFIPLLLIFIIFTIMTPYILAAFIIFLIKDLSLVFEASVFLFILATISLLYMVHKGITYKVSDYLYLNLLGKFLYEENKNNPFLYELYGSSFIFNNDILNFINEQKIETTINKDNSKKKPLSELNEEEIYLKEKLKKQRSINDLKAKIQAQEDMQAIHNKVEQEIKNRRI